MQKNFMRIPFTGPLPQPPVIPHSANSLNGAVTALTKFLSASPSPKLRKQYAPWYDHQTVLLTGAGISVASGLADYRGATGTYTLNKTYRPIYYGEFVENHEARKRYWARSFLGWTNLHRSGPNAAHYAVRDLAERGWVSSVITQNVDSFHAKAHPSLQTLELHGYLRSLVCLSCRNEYSREAFQNQLASLNPSWAEFLKEALASGALNTEHPEERRQRGLRANPDGDVDVPDAPYTTFRYPPCPVCLEKPPTLSNGQTAHVDVDSEGAWLATSNAGVLKPAVIMFGESIPAQVKEAAEDAIDAASRILVVGSSLATYSAWRLVKRAKEQRMPIAVLNMGGIRGDDVFFDVHESGDASEAVRCSHPAEIVLPALAREMG